jgi:hypothetical protein
MKTAEQRRLEHRLFCVREARHRGRSSWARDFWTIVEKSLVRHYNFQQGEKNV